MVLSVGMCGWGIVVLLAWPKDAFLQQIGAALLQTGLATLFIGYVGFELLVDERLPRALFGHGYFRVANKAERVRLLRSSIGALADLTPRDMADEKTIFPTYFGAVREFLEQTFAAPVRSQYRANVRLKQRGFDERPRQHGGAVRHDGLLTIEIEYRYTTQPNRLPHEVRVNGNGVVHRVDVALPRELELHAMLLQRGQVDMGEVLAWVKRNMRPEVWIGMGVQQKQSVTAEIAVEDVVVVEGDDTYRLQFPVRVDALLPPGETVRVDYIQQSPAQLEGEHHWVAFSATRGFVMQHSGFLEEGFGVIPFAESTPWSRHSEGSPEEPELDQDGEIRLEGVVFPGATFGYSWFQRHPES
jgi:hypothetical protein